MGSGDTEVRLLLTDPPTPWFFFGGAKVSCTDARPVRALHTRLRTPMPTAARRSRVLSCLVVVPALGGALTTSPQHVQGVS